MDLRPGRRRRRTHSAAFKAEAVAACRKPDASIAACALDQFNHVNPRGKSVPEVGETIRPNAFNRFGGKRCGFIYPAQTCASRSNVWCHWRYNYGIKAIAAVA